MLRRRGLLTGAASLALMGMGPAQRNLLLSGGNSGPSLRIPLFGPTLDSRLVFARASTGYYWNSAGILQPASANTPRFDYDPVALVPLGLLEEEQRTNLQNHSAFDSAITVNTTNILNAAVAPDGNTAACLITATAATTGIHHSDPAGSMPIPAASTVHCLSVFVKPAGSTHFGLHLRVGTNWINGVVDGNFVLTGSGTAALFDGGAQAGVGIAYVGNGWYRCWVYGMSAVSPTGGQANWYSVQNAAGSDNYTADGSESLYVWGAQWEALPLGGTTPSSIIPTLTTAATRAPDTLSMPVGSWFNPAAFTLMAEYMLPQGSNTSSAQRNVVGLFDATSANQAVLRGQQASSNTAAFATEVAGGAVTASGPLLTTAANTVEKVVASWVQGAQSGCGNGGTVVTTAAAGIPTVTNLAIGNDYSSPLSNLNGWARQVSAWPRAMAGTEQQQVST